MRLHVLVAEFGLACATFAQVPSELSLDELIDALPPTGCDFHRDPATGAWQEDPHSAALRAYVDARALSDEQWRRALLRTGAFRCRTRWVADAPWLVSLSIPSWIPNADLRITSRSRATDFAFDSNGSATCGSSWPESCASFWDMHGGRSFASFTSAERSLVCDVQIEKSGDPILGRKPAHPTIWNGALRFDLELVDTADALLTPCSGVEVDDRVRRAIAVTVCRDTNPYPSTDGHDRYVLAVKVELDVDGHETRDLHEVGIAFDLELLRDGEVVGDAWAVPMAVADLPHPPHPNAPAPRGFFLREFVAPMPLGAADDPRERARWSLRVRGDGIGALALWDSKSYWKGELVLPLADALAAYARASDRR